MMRSVPTTKRSLSAQNFFTDEPKFVKHFPSQFALHSISGTPYLYYLQRCPPCNYTSEHNPRYLLGNLGLWRPFLSLHKHVNSAETKPPALLGSRCSWVCCRTAQITTHTQWRALTALRDMPESISSYQYLSNTTCSGHPAQDILF